MYETKAKQLILDDHGVVIGVRAVGSDGVVDYMANAVVITAGGYAATNSSSRNSLARMPTR